MTRRSSPVYVDVYAIRVPEYNDNIALPPPQPPRMIFIIIEREWV